MDPLLISVCLLFSLAGCALGLFTGMIPGIHVNTLASVLLVTYGILEDFFQGIFPADYIPIAICSIIMAASVVHSFVDFVPSAFIGAPDSEDALSVLPGHRLLLQGEGMKAVRSAAIGSLIGCSAAIILAIPLQYLMLTGLSGILNTFTKFILVSVCMVLILNEQRKGKLYAGISCLLISGLLGYMVMNTPIPFHGILSDGTLLMPMLTGLFGIPTMLSTDADNPIPEQHDSRRDPVGIVPGLRGVFMGTIAGWFPGITSTVGATISATFMPERNPERFISTVASIGTVTTVLSLVTLSVSGGGRSGTVIVIGYILGDSISGFASSAFILMLISAGIGALLGYISTIECGKIMSSLVSKVSQRRMNRIVITLLIILVIMTTGFWGVIVMTISMMVGMIPVIENMGKTTLCGCLIIPVLLM